MTSGFVATPRAELLFSGTGALVHYLTLQATEEGQAAHAHVHEIIDGLGRRGWRTELFEPQFSTTSRRSALGRIRVSARLLEFGRLQWRLLCHPNRPDILYVRAHPLAIFALWWARLRGIRSVAEVNSTYEDVYSMYPWTTRLSWLVEFVGDSCLRAAGNLITVTPELGCWLVERLPGKPVSVIPNGANIALFRPGVPPTLSHLSPYVLFVGAMSRWQGIEFLLAATCQAEWPENVRLVLAGDGVERQRVEAEALRNNRVCFLGTQPYRTIPALLTGALAAFSVGTSVRRNFSPLKLYEALACATPVIVSDQPGQANLVRELACGLVVPEGDPVAIARAVGQIATNAQGASEMGLRGYRGIHAGHSWQHRADNTGTILLQVLSGSHCSSQSTAATDG